MKRRGRRYRVNGRRLFVILVGVALAVALGFRHQIERALALRQAPTAAARGRRSPNGRAGPGSGSRRSDRNTSVGTSNRADNGTDPSVPPTANYPGAPAIASFYADLSSGKGPDAYALLAPGLASRVTPNAFGRSYAAVRRAQVRSLALQATGTFTRTFAVTVAFTLTSGTVETKSGTITVQDQSGGVGTPQWAISALSVAP